ncbi:hypothetical protein ACNOYE_03100 [Nannocystaceae bacterium ST9]
MTRKRDFTLLACVLALTACPQGDDSGEQGDEVSDSGESDTGESDTGDDGVCEMPPLYSCPEGDRVVRVDTDSCPAIEGWEATQISPEFWGWCRMRTAMENPAPFTEVEKSANHILEVIPNCDILPEAMFDIDAQRLTDFQSAIGAVDADTREAVFGTGSPVTISVVDTPSFNTDLGVAEHGRFIAAAVRDLTRDSVSGGCTRCINTYAGMPVDQYGKDNYTTGGYSGRVDTLITALLQVPQNPPEHVVIMALGSDPDFLKPPISIFDDLLNSGAVLIAPTGNLRDLANIDPVAAAGVAPTGATFPANLAGSGGGCDTTRRLYAVTPVDGMGNNIMTFRRDSNASFATLGVGGIATDFSGFLGPFTGSSVGPLVVGSIIALLMSYYPDLDNCELMQTVWESGTPLEDPAPGGMKDRIATVGPWTTQHGVTVCGALKYACKKYKALYPNNLSYQHNCDVLTCVTPVAVAQAPCLLTNHLCGLDAPVCQVDPPAGVCAMSPATQSRDAIFPQPDETLCKNCGIGPMGGGQMGLFMTEADISQDLLEVHVRTKRVSGNVKDVLFDGKQLAKSVHGRELPHCTPSATGYVAIPSGDFAHGSDPIVSAHIEAYQGDSSTGAPVFTSIRGNSLLVFGCDPEDLIAQGCSEGDGGGTDPFVFAANPPNDYTRVDRMGLPSIATALISSMEKDNYNAANPESDNTFFSEISMSISNLHGVFDSYLEPQALVPCAPDVCLEQAAPLLIPDTLKLDITKTNGFPNGRGLPDRVFDIVLAMILLDLGVPGQGLQTLAELPLSQTQNDVEFSADFPYLAAPN